MSDPCTDCRHSPVAAEAGAGAGAGATPRQCRPGRSTLSARSRPCPLPKTTAQMTVTPAPRCPRQGCLGGPVPTASPRPAAPAQAPLPRRPAARPGGMRSVSRCVLPRPGGVRGCALKLLPPPLPPPVPATSAPQPRLFQTLGGGWRGIGTARSCWWSGWSTTASSASTTSTSTTRTRPHRAHRPRRPRRPPH